MKVTKLLLIGVVLILRTVTAAHIPPAGFKSGMNQAWSNYANDFGNNQYRSSSTALVSGLDQLQANGGNIVRTWLHTNCANTPQFDSAGRVIATDAANSLISDVRQYLRAAAARGIQVVLTLFNGAAAMDAKLVGLIQDSGKLQTYIDVVLTPMITALAAEPGLHSIDIVNEPDGSVLGHTAHDEPCFDTSAVNQGWNTGYIFPMKTWLIFINRLASAIHTASATTKVTVGPSKMDMITGAFASAPHAAYLGDACLVKAGGRANGVLDYYQPHSYLQWVTGADVFFHSAVDYKLDKPLLVGETDHDVNNEYGHGAWSGAAVYRFFYNHGYIGMMGWAINDPSSPHFSFSEHIKGMLAVADGNGCTDTAPASSSASTCAAAVSAGTCMNTGVVPAGNCLKSCNACGLPPVVPCSDVAPDTTYTCAQQASWGKCNQTWMVPSGRCLKSCGACSAADSCTMVSCGSYGTCYRGLCTCTAGWTGTRCEFAPSGPVTTSPPPPASFSTASAPPPAQFSTASEPVVNGCATNNGGCGPVDSTLCSWTGAVSAASVQCSCLTGFTGQPPSEPCKRLTPPPTSCAFSATDAGSNGWWLSYSITAKNSNAPAAQKVSVLTSGGQSIAMSGPFNWGDTKPTVFTAGVNSLSTPFALLITDASGALTTITVTSFSSGTTFTC